MLASTELRAGMTIRYQGELHRVITAVYHSGGGKMGGVTHARLKNLRTGTQHECRFRPDEMLEPVATERQTMQFLYNDAEACHFMNPETYEQVDIENKALGKAVAYLSEGMLLPVELLEGVPLGVMFPELVEARISETAPPTRSQGTDNVWKEARLENGARIMVPPFIAQGEVVKVDVEAARYVERVHHK